jgi:crotonobetainyl-CoA:carnitine CoA-transferase CaiB-like acyl-CoA transferase
MSDDAPGEMLRGLRVLDAGSFIAAPLAAMLLGDWGAEVVKLEPAGGDAARTIGEQAAPGMSSTFVSCNRGKRSVALDLRAPEATATVRRLAATCDIVIHNLPPATARRLGLDHDALMEHRADAVLCTITAFGETGPYAGRAALDPIVQAMAGLAAATGEPAGEPMRCAAPVVDTAAGFAAAAAALAALHARGSRGGRVSVSLLDVALVFQGPLLAARSLLGAPPPRRGNASYAVLGDQVATADGLLAFVVWDDRRWAALCDVLGVGETLATDPRFATNDARCAQQEALLSHLREAFARHPGRRLEAQLLAAGVPCAVTQDLDAVVVDEHVVASGAVYDEGRLGAATLTLASSPVRVDGRRPRAPLRPPYLGEHTDELLAGLLPPVGEGSR